MNRLTRKMCGGYGMVEGYELDTMRGAMTAIGRLAAYEDTGLEPEEIKEVQENLAPIPFGRFHDIMQAEREGRVVVLPCKPGEYWRDQNGDKVRIETVSFCRSRRLSCDTHMVTYTYEDEGDDFAVNWIYFHGHFTREKAENQEGGGACEE